MVLRRETILEHHLNRIVRRLLNELDRDPYSLTRGCFDRRYWGWKLTDYPDATFQRNIFTLSWRSARASEGSEKKTLLEAVKLAFSFTARIQHSDGSFDQAFPNERSYGATAFLINQLVDAYVLVEGQLTEAEKRSIRQMLSRALNYLCNNDERHGTITNHVASAALALFQGAELFGLDRYERKAAELLQNILSTQSQEGWFPEYDGADPGYQTLCLYYLARIWRIRGGEGLFDALGSAVSFLSWFVHPDGSFGGEYGSRRTGIFYPGGFAILSKEMPMAKRVLSFMLNSIAEGTTVTLKDVDVANIAPLSINYIEYVESWTDGECAISLPFEREKSACDFNGCGIHVRGSTNYYAVVGAANGGVLRVFDKIQKKELCNDGGYIGKLSNGTYITTQATKLPAICEIDENTIKLKSRFYKMTRRKPTPLSFLFLRLANLTIMRSKIIREWVKRHLVKMLMKNETLMPLWLTRQISMDINGVEVNDDLHMEKNLDVEWLEHCRSFVSIHMASSKYFEGYRSSKDAKRLNVSSLMNSGKLSTDYLINNA